MSMLAPLYVTLDPGEKPYSTSVPYGYVSFPDLLPPDTKVYISYVVL